MQEVDYVALAGFRYAVRRFLAFSNAAAADAGLTSQQHQALLAIKGFGGTDGLSVGDLAERLLIRNHTAVELVDRLMRAGLVERSHDPADRRRVLISVSEQGEARLANLSSTHLDELRRLRPALLRMLEDIEG